MTSRNQICLLTTHSISHDKLLAKLKDTLRTEEDHLVSPEYESQPVSREQGVEPRNEETSSSVRTPPVELGNLTEEQ